VFGQVDFRLMGEDDSVRAFLEGSLELREESAFAREGQESERGD
jgi:hypothetical protein